MALNLRVWAIRYRLPHLQRWTKFLSQHQRSMGWKCPSTLPHQLRFIQLTYSGVTNFDAVWLSLLCITAWPSHVFISTANAAFYYFSPRYIFAIAEEWAWQNLSWPWRIGLNCIADDSAISYDYHWRHYCCNTMNRYITITAINHRNEKLALKPFID